MFSLSITIPLEVLMDRAEMERIAAAGIRYLCVTPSFYDLGEARVREKAAELSALGLVIDTCHPPFGGGNGANSLCAEDEAVRQETIRTYTHYIRTFGWTGVRAIPVHTGGCMHPAGGPKSLDRLTDTLRQLVGPARESGVLLALENTFYANPCPFTDAPDPSGVDEERINDDCSMLRRYVEEWADPNIRVCHDIGHSMLYGHRLMEDLEALAPLTVLYHIHDNDGVRDCHWNVGEGCLPWKDFTAFLNARGEYPWPLYDEALSERYEENKSLSVTDRIIRGFRLAVKTLEG